MSPTTNTISRNHSQNIRDCLALETRISDLPEFEWLNLDSIFTTYSHNSQCCLSLETRRSDQPEFEWLNLESISRTRTHNAHYNMSLETRMYDQPEFEMLRLDLIDHPVGYQELQVADEFVFHRRPPYASLTSIHDPVRPAGRRFVAATPLPPPKRFVRRPLRRSPTIH
jgi:hypothetical protein